MNRLDAIEARMEAAITRIAHEIEDCAFFDPVDTEEAREELRVAITTATAAARTDVPDLVGLVRTLGEALRNATLFTEHAKRLDGCSVCAALRLYDEWGSA